MKLTAIHSRMARAALELGVRDLAEMAKVSADTIARLERGEELKERTLETVQSALESAGVIFVAENGEGPGVRLRKRPETAADLTHKIDTIEADIQKTKGPSAKTPEGGMQRLERARNRNVVTKLKNRRTKLGKT